MLRTVISLDPQEKAWLDQEAELEHVSMAAVVRKAILHYRLSLESKQNPNINTLLKKTSGIWKQGDGLAYQQKIRDEWDK